MTFPVLLLFQFQKILFIFIPLKSLFRYCFKVYLFILREASLTGFPGRDPSAQSDRITDMPKAVHSQGLSAGEHDITMAPLQPAPFLRHFVWSPSLPWNLIALSHLFMCTYALSIRRIKICCTLSTNQVLPCWGWHWPHWEGMIMYYKIVQRICEEIVFKACGRRHDYILFHNRLFLSPQKSSS